MSRSILGSLLVLTIPSLSFAQETTLPPQRAVERIELPEGFRASLFAGEPDVVKPIAMTTDDRGRLWVVESHSYPNWLPDGKEGRDRILIFEDKKGTGHFDSCKVFWDRGTNLSGIAVGFGGVWLCATPNLLFIPMRPGEDKPAGPPRVRARRLELEGQAQRLQRSHLGAGRLAVRLQRHPVHFAHRQAGHARHRARRLQLRRLALSPGQANASRCSPGARPTPGAWTSTITARCSSPTASSSISFTSYRARTTSACSARISIPTATA